MPPGVARPATPVNRAAINQRGRAQISASGVPGRAVGPAGAPEGVRDPRICCAAPDTHASLIFMPGVRARPIGAQQVGRAARFYDSRDRPGARRCQGKQSPTMTANEPGPPEIAAALATFDFRAPANGLSSLARRALFSARGRGSGDTSAGGSAS